MADIAVITGASSGLGVKFLEAVVNRYRRWMDFLPTQVSEFGLTNKTGQNIINYIEKTGQKRYC